MYFVFGFQLHIVPIIPRFQLGTLGQSSVNVIEARTQYKHSPKLAHKVDVNSTETGQAARPGLVDRFELPPNASPIGPVYCCSKLTCALGFRC